jgi:3-deoxy-D-manno-octulosonic-acid transferase
VKFVGNLKSAAPPLPADENELSVLRTALGDRPHWLAASTHPGEDEAVGRAHLALKDRFPDLLTFVAPRHADRGGQMAEELKALGLEVALRSNDEPLSPTTDIYLADTMGELGLFYRLADIAFLGGSLIPHGGQNPLEAARLGCCVLHGPHVFNFTDSIAGLGAVGGARLVGDGMALTETVADLLGEPDHCRNCAQAARRAAEEDGNVLERVMAEITPFLPAGPSGGASTTSEVKHARA